MPCIAAPKLPLIQLPSPLKLTLPALPIPSISLSLCCNISLPPPDLPYPLSLLTNPPPGPTINLSVINAFLGGVIGKINSYLDKLQLDCPLE